MCMICVFLCSVVAVLRMIYIHCIVSWYSLRALFIVNLPYTVVIVVIVLDHSWNQFLAADMRYKSIYVSCEF